MYNAARQQGGVDFFRWALTKGQNQSTELDQCRSRRLCRANRRVVEILVRGPELRRFIRKIVWVQDAEGLDPRHWCLLIPGRRPASQSIDQSGT